MYRLTKHRSPLLTLFKSNTIKLQRSSYNFFIIITWQCDKLSGGLWSPCWLSVYLLFTPLMWIHLQMLLRITSDTTAAHLLIPWNLLESKWTTSWFVQKAPEVNTRLEKSIFTIALEAIISTSQALWGHDLTSVIFWNRFLCCLAFSYCTAVNIWTQ